MPYPASDVFKRKNSKILEGCFEFWSAKVVRGNLPLASQFLQVSAWRKLGKLKPMDVHRQCLLFFCKLPGGNLWVLGCIGSLLKTHTGVSALLRYLWNFLVITGKAAIRRKNLSTAKIISVGNEKAATNNAGQIYPAAVYSSFCVS